jgi:hypothetical protein
MRRDKNTFQYPGHTPEQQVLLAAQQQRSRELLQKIVTEPWQASLFQHIAVAFITYQGLNTLQPEATADPEILQLLQERLDGQAVSLDTKQAALLQIMCWYAGLTDWAARQKYPKVDIDQFWNQFQSWLTLVDST